MLPGAEVRRGGWRARQGWVVSLRSQGAEDFGLRAPEVTGGFKPR